MKALAQKLVDRRVPQYLLIYIGFAWGIMEFSKFLVDVFLISPHWTKLAFFATLMFWPGYLLLVYRHGQPGRDSWGLPEKIGIPANILLAAAALFVIFRGTDLGAATTSVTVADEAGNVVERTVAKQEFRKRIMFFDFDSEALANEDEWLAGFLPDAVYLDVLGDDFFDPVGPSHFAERLRRAGYPTLRGVPLALKREIAEELHADWIFAGTVGKAGANYSATITLHGARDGARVAQESYIADDLFDLVDRISTDLRRHLAIPQRDDVPDLPAEDYFTSNREALPPYGRARDVILVDRDWAGAIELLQQAVALDQTFTLAQYSLAAVLTLSNRNAEAVPAIQAALTNVYRLPERAQFTVKADYYGITQNLEKAWAVIEMWAELYPEDTIALQNLFTAQIAQNQRAAAVATLERIYASNSGMADVLKQIASLEGALGNFDKARDALQRYIDRFPDDYTGLQSLANIELRTGDLDAARKSIDRALLLEPTSTELIVASARLYHRVGDFAAAEAGFKAALATAPSANARLNALSALHTYYRVQGQTTEALATLEQRLEEARAVMAPVQVALARLTTLDVYLDNGRETEARAIIDEYAGETQPPLSLVVGIAKLQLAVENGDVAAADTELAAVEAGIERSGLENFRGGAQLAAAKLAGLKGDWQRACDLREENLRANPTDIFVPAGIAECLRELGRLDEAERSVRTTLATIPGSATANVELARILRARGDAAGARAALERALEIWSLAEPSFEPAAEARQLLASG